LAEFLRLLFPATTTKIFFCCSLGWDYCNNIGLRPENSLKFFYEVSYTQNLPLSALNKTFLGAKTHGILNEKSTFKGFQQFLMLKLFL